MRLANLAHAALAAAVAVEVAVLAVSIINQRRAASYEIHAGVRLGALTGYGLDFASGPHVAPGGCAIYRFVSNRCPYCGQDELAWGRLRSLADRSGCKILILLPGIRYAPYHQLRGLAPEIIWVPLDWASSLHLLLTPTTIVSYRGRVLWAWQGALGAEGLSGLIACLERLSQADGRR